MKTLTNKVAGIVRSVAWPYDVYKKDPDGEILYRHSAATRVPDPVVDPVPTWAAKILSLITTIIAINVAIKQLTGVGIKDLLNYFFPDLAQ